MANNRLYIRVKGTNDVMFIAKAFGAWDLRVSADQINQFLSSRGFDSACSGGPSEFELITEDELSADDVFFKPAEPQYESFAVFFDMAIVRPGEDMSPKDWADFLSQIPPPFRFCSAQVEGPHLYVGNLPALQQAIKWDDRLQILQL